MAPSAQIEIVSNRIDTRMFQTYEKLGELVDKENRDEDLEATAEVGSAALLRLEIRYMRRDLQELKDLIKDGLLSKADHSDMADLSQDVKDFRNDHEIRLRAVERQIYWALGFGAAAGAVVHYLVELIKK